MGDLARLRPLIRRLAITLSHFQDLDWDDLGLLDFWTSGASLVGVLALGGGDLGAYMRASAHTHTPTHTVIHPPGVRGPLTTGGWSSSALLFPSSEKRTASYTPVRHTTARIVVSCVVQSYAA